MKNKDKDIAVETIGLSKSFGGFEAVKHVNLQLKKGEIYALVGSNGAGKTTFMKCIVGLLSPTEGHASIWGNDIEGDPITAKKLFGYVSDDPLVYDYLSGLEFLALTGNLRGMAKLEIDRKIKELIKLFPIEGILERSMSLYSRGNRQKVAFLSAIMSEPQVLFIDEPVAGLDPLSIEMFGKTIRNYVKKDKSVFFISHSLPFAQKYSHRVGLMENGKIVKEARTSQIEDMSDFFGIK